MESVGGMALPSQSPFAARNRLNAILPCRRSARRHFLSTSPVVARARLHSILPSRRPAQRMAWPPRRSWCERGPQSLLPCRPTPPAQFPHPPRVPLLLRPTFHSTDTHHRSTRLPVPCRLRATLCSVHQSPRPRRPPFGAAGCCSSRVFHAPNHSLKQPAAAVARPPGRPSVPRRLTNGPPPGRPSHVRSQVRRFAAAHCSPIRGYHGVALRVA